MLPKDDELDTEERVDEPDGDETGDEATTEPDEPGEPDDADRPRSWVKLVAVLVVVLAAAGVIGWLALSVRDARHTEALRAEAVSTSRDYLVAMAEFDYERLDANDDTIAANSTPEFAGKYTEMVRALRDIVVASKGKATATADRVAVEDLTDTSATVIAFVDQQVTNVTSPHTNTQHYRMLVELIRSDGRWIVDNVETL